MKLTRKTKPLLWILAAAAAYWMWKKHSTPAPLIQTAPVQQNMPGL